MLIDFLWIGYWNISASALTEFRLRHCGSKKEICGLKGSVVELFLP